MTFVETISSNAFLFGTLWGTFICITTSLVLRRVRKNDPKA